MNFKLYGEQQGETNSEKELQIAIKNIEKSLIHTSDTEKQIDDFAEIFSCIFRYANYKKINLTDTGALDYWYLNAKNYSSNELKTKEGFISILQYDLKNLSKKDTLFQMILNSIVFATSLGLNIESISNKTIIKPSVVDEVEIEKKSIKKNKN